MLLFKPHVGAVMPTATIKRLDQNLTTPSSPMQSCCWQGCFSTAKLFLSKLCFRTCWSIKLLSVGKRPMRAGCQNQINRQLRLLQKSIHQQQLEPILRIQISLRSCSPSTSISIIMQARKPPLGRTSAARTHLCWPGPS
jgi:hypothetical protein